jgi:hypothetical protein
MKNFVKVMDQTGPAFTHLTEKFPGISAAKTKSGVFVSPQIRKIFRDEQLTSNSQLQREEGVE